MKKLLPLALSLHSGLLLASPALDAGFSVRTGICSCRIRVGRYRIVAIGSVRRR